MASEKEMNAHDTRYEIARKPLEVRVNPSPVIVHTHAAKPSNNHTLAAAGISASGALASSGLTITGMHYISKHGGKL